MWEPLHRRGQEGFEGCQTDGREADPSAQEYKCPYLAQIRQQLELTSYPTLCLQPSQILTQLLCSLSRPQSACPLLSARVKILCR